jgi:hypothetical protein
MIAGRARRRITGRSRSTARLAGPATLLAAVVFAGSLARAETNYPPTSADTSFEALDSESSQGHGSFTIGFTNSLGNGLRISDGDIAHNGQTRIRSLNLDIDYHLTDRWSIHAGIPYVSNRYQGPAPHCPTALPAACASRPALDPAHPESQFLDDGQYHGAWQDWSLGIAYFKDLDGYLLTPSLTVYLPSHDYTFFANAAPGQRLWKVEPGIELAHQFDFTNIYYRIRYAYVVAQRTLGTSINHNRFDLEFGYFINPDLSLRVFTLGRIGNGYKAADLVPQTQGFTNELWYVHDQVSAHNFAAAGIGGDYRLNDRYTLSASAQRLYWGQTVFNFQYTYDIRLTRSF